MKDLLKLMLIPEDKANHVIWSYLLCVFVFIIAGAINYAIGSNCDVATVSYIASGVTLVLGLLKEVYDYYGEGNSSWSDVLANVTGVSAFAVVASIVSVLK